MELFLKCFTGMQEKLDCKFYRNKDLLLKSRLNSTLLLKIAKPPKK